MERSWRASERPAILAAAAFPFVCLAWAALAFIFHALVNEGLLHRDPGLGDGWNCPLPNGYAIIMINQTDYGWVYNPKTQPFDAVSEQEDATAGVRKLQLSGRYILGASLSNWFGRTDIPENEADSFFVLDTQAGEQTKFSS